MKCFNLLFGISNDQGLFFYNIDNLAMWIEYPPQLLPILPLRSPLFLGWRLLEKAVFHKSAELPNRLAENALRLSQAKEDPLEIVSILHMVVPSRHIQRKDKQGDVCANKRVYHDQSFTIQGHKRKHEEARHFT